MRKLYSFLQIELASKQAKSLFLRYLILVSSTSIILLFSRTFYVLYVIDKTSMASIAILFAISYAVQSLIDYPTSNLQNKFSTRVIYFVAMSLYGLVFILFPLADDFNDFLILFVIEGIARSQESGTLNSWFDNNYKHLIADEDPEYEMYVGFTGIMMVIDSTLSILFAVLGGFFSTYLISGRKMVFIIQGIALFILAGVSLYLIIDFTKAKKSEENSIQHLLFFLKLPTIRIFVIVLILDWMTSSIWMDILMFPIIFAYTGSDFLASVLTLIIFIFSVFLVYLAGEVGKTAKLSKWVPVSLLIQTVFTFGITLILLSVMKMENTLNVIACLILVIAIASAAFSISLYEVLTKKFYITTVPDDKRNSFYSLIPSLTLIASALMNFFASHILAIFNIKVLIVIIIIIRLIASCMSYFSLKSYDLEIDSDIVIRTEFPYIFDRELKEISKSFTYFKPSEWYISETIKHTWLKLVEVAKQGDDISDDAIQLLSRSMVEVHSYLKLLESGLEDGILDKAEIELLKIKRKQILQDIVKVAQADGVIVEEEERIITKLKEIINELSRIEQSTFKGRN